MGKTHTIQVQAMLTQTSANGGTAQALIAPETLNGNAVNLKKSDTETGPAARMAPGV